MREKAMERFWEYGEPGINRVTNGIPNRQDRIKCLGNTASPQQFYPFFMWIAQIESENRNE